MDVVDDVEWLDLCRPNEPKNYTDTLGYWNEVKSKIEKL